MSGTEELAPGERLLRSGARAFGIHASVRRGSHDVERVTVAAVTPDPATLPVTVPASGTTQ